MTNVLRLRSADFGWECPHGEDCPLCSGKTRQIWGFLALLSPRSAMEAHSSNPGTMPSVENGLAYIGIVRLCLGLTSH